MSVQDTEQLWGGETTKAVANFPVSGEPVPVAVLRWLGRIKGAAARVNADLGLLDGALAERIAEAADAIAAGRHDGQFPVDVFQTGSGTSSNMNANEVIATLAGDERARQRPRQHGPVVQRRVPLGRAPRGARRGDQSAAARARPARAGVRRQGGGVRPHRQGRAHAPHGRGPRDARSGVLRLRGADPARPGARDQRAAPRRPDPARRYGHGHRAQHPSRLRRARARPARGRHRARHPRARGRRSRRRATATRSSSCRARSRSSPCRSPRSPTTSR